MVAPIRSSLPLQVLLFFNGWFDAALVIIMVALFIWKGSVLPIPSEIEAQFALDISLVFGLVILEYTRIFLGSRGNKTEQTAPLLWFGVLSLPALGVNLYYMFLQCAAPAAPLERATAVAVMIAHPHVRAVLCERARVLSRTVMWTDCGALLLAGCT